MIKLFRQYVSTRKIVFIIGEGILIFLAVFLAAFYFLGRGISIEGLLEMIWPKVLVIVIVAQLSLYFSDLYEFKATDSSIDLASRLIQSIGITSIFLAAVYYLWPDMIIGRWIFFASLILLLLFLVSWRLLYSFGIRKKLFTEKAIVLGSGGLARNILDEINSRKDLPYNIDLVIMHDRTRTAMISLEICPLTTVLTISANWWRLKKLGVLLWRWKKGEGFFRIRHSLTVR